MRSVFASVLKLGVIDTGNASLKNDHDPIPMNLSRVASYRKISPPIPDYAAREGRQRSRTRSQTQKLATGNLVSGYWQ